MVYDCTISGDFFARQPKLTTVEEYVYRLQLLMSVDIKLKAFKLTRTINEVFLAVEFESERGEKYASPIVLNNIEVSNAARQVQARGNVDKVIKSVVELCKTLWKQNKYTLEVLI